MMTSTPSTVTPDTLNLAVEFDRPFRVTSAGTLEVVPNVYAPEVWHVEGESHPHDVELSGDWSPWSAGYTGQHGYRGAVMHSSEYLGGRMARDLLAEPGVYVVCAVEVHAEDAYPGEGDSPAPAGWIVLRHKLEDPPAECDGCDLDPWRAPLHYGACPLAPREDADQ